MLETIARDGAFYVRTRHNTGSPLVGAFNEHWRAFTVVRNRLMTTSLFSYSEDPLKGGSGVAELVAFISRTRLINP